MAEPTIPTQSTRMPQFSSRYELQEKLGAGGMGAVYKAFDKVLGKTVGVKLLLPSMRKESAVRFHNEAKACARLEHPNILKVLDFGQTGKGDFYLIMDYIGGISLAGLIKESGPLPLSDALDIFIQICAGLEHAHGRGVLHRDVKPSNIMLSKEKDGGYQVKIVDFGIAKLKSDEQKLTTTGARIGSPLYMSPEQARGEEVDQRSDIYSMGCLMFATLTGVPPLCGESYMDTVSKQIEEQPPRVSQFLNDQEVPEQFADIIDKALRKDPAARYQSFSELERALTRFKEEWSLRSIISTAQDKQAIQNKGTKWSGVFSRNNILCVSALLSVVIIFAGFIAQKTDIKPLRTANTAKLAAEAKQENLPDLNKSFFYQEVNDAQRWLIAGGNIHANKIKELKAYSPVTMLKISDPNFDDEDLPYLSNEPIQILDLSNTSINVTGLEQLRSLHSLRSLNLNNNKQINDNAVLPLSQLHQLEILGLAGTSMRNDETLCGLLKSMPQLISLDISNRKTMSSELLDAICTMPKLRALRIGGTQLHKSDLERLAACKRMRGLSLSATGLNDSDLEPLTEMSLCILDLSSNPDITAQGIKAIDPGAFWCLNLKNCKSITRSEILELDRIRGQLGFFANDYEETPLHYRKNIPQPYRADLSVAYWFDPKEMSFRTFEYGRAFFKTGRIKTKDIEIRFREQTQEDPKRPAKLGSARDVIEKIESFLTK